MFSSIGIPELWPASSSASRRSGSGYFGGEAVEESCSFDRALMLRRMSCRPRPFFSKYCRNLTSLPDFRYGDRRAAPLWPPSRFENVCRSRTAVRTRGWQRSVSQ